MRRLGQHNAQLVQQLQETLAASAEASAKAGSSKAVASNSMAVQACAAAEGAGVAAGGEGAPVSPRTLQHIIAAATRVNEKNKKLKKQLQAMQRVSSH